MPDVHLNKTQLDAILEMDEAQFQRWCLSLERLRYVYWQQQQEQTT